MGASAQAIELTAAAVSRDASRHTAALQAAQPSRVLATTASSAPTVQYAPNLSTCCAGVVHTPSEPQRKTTLGATPTPCVASAGRSPKHSGQASQDGQCASTDGGRATTRGCEEHGRDREVREERAEERATGENEIDVARSSDAPMQAACVASGSLVISSSAIGDPPPNDRSTPPPLREQSC